MSTTDTPTREQAERDAEILAKVTDQLMTGKTFALKAASCRSITGYQPPSQVRSYGDALAVLAKGTRISDRMARLVHVIVGGLPFASTPGDTVAAMYDAAGRALAAGFFDHVGAASPEPGRRSDHEHTYTLRDRLLLSVLLANASACYLPTGSRHGWAMQAIIDQELRGEGPSGLPSMPSWCLNFAGGVK